jgi:uncharacterized protein YuzB (UPF0349 family)
MGVTSYVTKSTTIDHESTPTNIQLFIFRNSGTDKSKNVLDVKTTNTTLSFDVTTTTGPKSFYALVNAPVLAADTEAELLNHVSSLSENAVATSFEMIGKADFNVAETASQSVPIEVNRICARIKLEKITNSLSAPYSVLHIKNIYVSNAAGDVNLAAALEPATAYTVSKWYNVTDGFYASDAFVDGLLYDNAIATDLANTKASTGTHYLYTYPNKQNSMNVTRLVVAATIDSDAIVYYYPITLPEAVAPNKSFNVSNITITRPGTVTPNEPIVTEACTVNITVKPWGDVAVPDPTI